MRCKKSAKAWRTYRLQADEEMAHFENCQISDQECLSGGALRVPMLADVAYLFVVRGYFGKTGLLKFRLECDNAPGQLPSWADKGTFHFQLASSDDVLSRCSRNK